MIHDYGKNLILDLVLGDGVQPDPVYLALMFTQPVEADTGADLDEPAGGGYARVSVANDAANWPAAVNDLKDNGADITFPTATADWGSGPVVYFAICDAAAGGNVIASGRLNTARRVLSGRTPRFKAGEFQVSTAD